MKIACRDKSTVIRYNKLALGKEASVGPAGQVPVYPVKWNSERERERKNVARVIVVASEALR